MSITLIPSMTQIIEDLNTYFNSKKILLNQLKSSIKLSYGTKKQLDKLNENKQTYEEIILNLIEENQYLRNKKSSLISKSSNIKLNFNIYERTKKLFDFLGYKIIYSYNEGSYIDENFYFAVQIEEITRNGEIQKLKDVFFNIWLTYRQEYEDRKNFSKGELIGEYVVYFILLTNLLMEKFNLKLTASNQLVTQLEYWEYTLNKRNISGKIKEKDINDKIDSFRVHLKQNEIDKRKN